MVDDGETMVWKEMAVIISSRVDDPLTEMAGGLGRALSLQGIALTPRRPCRRGELKVIGRRRIAMSDMLVVSE